eukprot:SAG11_NODE_5974_length_1422_cov_0.811036_2_plen_167_part_00
MAPHDRAQHEGAVLAAYHATLVEHGVSGYSEAALEADYRACLWLTAALYALPDVYDRGSPSQLAPRPQGDRHYCVSAACNRLTMCMSVCLVRPPRPAQRLRWRTWAPRLSSVPRCVRTYSRYCWQGRRSRCCARIFRLHWRSTYRVLLNRTSSLWILDPDLRTSHR